MDPTNLTDDQLDDLAAQLAPRLPTGSHGDRVVLSRRQFAAAATGVLSTGALMALGVDEASAQAAGQVGTSSEPVDAFAYNLDVANGVTSSLPMGGNDIENAGSVSTSGLSVDGQESDVHWETVVSLTDPANLPLVYNDVISSSFVDYRIIMRSEAVADTTINLSLNTSTGDSDYLLEDQSGAATNPTGQDSFELIKNNHPAPSGLNGKWVINYSYERAVVFGNGSQSRNNNYQVLTRGGSDEFQGLQKIEVGVTGSLNTAHIEIQERDMR